VSLDLLASASIPPHTAVFLNDPKLSDLKQLLQTQGFKAEFSLGVLYVNSVVSIKKLATGEFKVEGTLCDDFYRIRHIVYGQFAIV
jgi:cleavage and polyadenylation specificity factor subunit 2